MLKFGSEQWLVGVVEAGTAPDGGVCSLSLLLALTW